MWGKEKKTWHEEEQVGIEDKLLSLGCILPPWWVSGLSQRATAGFEVCVSGMG